MNFSRLFSSRPEPNPVADVLREQLQIERQRNDTLMATIVELRREGFQPPPPAYTPDAKGPEIPYDVLDVMAEQAEPGTAVWSNMEREVRKMLAAELSPEQIAEAVRRGEEFSWED